MTRPSTRTTARSPPASTTETRNVHVIDGPTAGRPWSSTAARTSLCELGATAGVRRRVAPHQLRHAHAVEMAREGVPLNVIQRQLGHAKLGVTSIYLQGIDHSEVINTV